MSKLKVSLCWPAFSDLRNIAERVTMIKPDTIMGMQIKIDEDFKNNDWIVCHEKTIVTTLE